MRSNSILFPNFFLDSLAEGQNYRGHSHVEETTDAYFIELDAPGFKREDISISVDNRMLTIEGTRKGRTSLSLKRVFSLPDEVETSSIAAQMRDGVLELSLPKKEQAKPKQVAIQEAKESFFQRILPKNE
jgi:HSP20 family protein